MVVLEDWAIIKGNDTKIAYKYQLKYNIFLFYLKFCFFKKIKGSLKTV